MSSQLTQSLVYEAQPAPDVDTVSGRHPKELGSKFTVVCTLWEARALKLSDIFHVPGTLTNSGDRHTDDQ